MERSFVIFFFHCWKAGNGQKRISMVYHGQKYDWTLT